MEKIQVTTPELQCNEADARQKCTSSLTETEIMNLNMKYKETMDVEIIQELINDKCKTLLKVNYNPRVIRIQKML